MDYFMKPIPGQDRSQQTYPTLAPPFEKSSHGGDQGIVGKAGYPPRQHAPHSSGPYPKSQVPPFVKSQLQQNNQVDIFRDGQRYRKPESKQLPLPKWRSPNQNSMFKQGPVPTQYDEKQYRQYLAGAEGQTLDSVKQGFIPRDRKQNQNNKQIEENNGSNKERSEDGVQWKQTGNNINQQGRRQLVRSIRIDQGQTNGNRNSISNSSNTYTSTSGVLEKYLQKKKEHSALESRADEFPQQSVSEVFGNKVYKDLDEVVNKDRVENQGGVEKSKPTLVLPQVCIIPFLVI